MPQDIHKAKSIISYKNQGFWSDCDNNRIFFLLKLLVKILYIWFFLIFWSWPGRVHRFLWCRTDLTILPLTWFFLQNKYKRKAEHIFFFIALIDFNKAFDLVKRQYLFATLFIIFLSLSYFNIVFFFNTKTWKTIKFYCNFFDLL